MKEIICTKLPSARTYEYESNIEGIKLHLLFKNTLYQVRIGNAPSTRTLWDIFLKQGKEQKQIAIMDNGVKEVLKKDNSVSGRMTKIEYIIRTVYRYLTDKKYDFKAIPNHDVLEVESLKIPEELSAETSDIKVTLSK